VCQTSGAQLTHYGQNGPGCVRIAKAPIVCQTSGAQLTHYGQNGPGCVRIAKAPIVCQTSGAQLTHYGQNGPGCVRIAKAPIVCQTSGAQLTHYGQNGPGCVRIAKAPIVCQTSGAQLTHYGQNGPGCVRIAEIPIRTRFRVGPLWRDRPGSVLIAKAPMMNLRQSSIHPFIHPSIQSSPLVAGNGRLSSWRPRDAASHPKRILASPGVNAKRSFSSFRRRGGQGVAGPVGGGLVEPVALERGA